MPEHVPEEKELLQLLSRDSEYAFAVLFDKYRKRVYGTALLFLKNPEAAEEIVQEVFLRLWQKRKALQPIQYLNSYINAMTRNLVIDQVRKMDFEEAYKKVSAAAAPVNDADFKVRDNESTQLLARAIESLPERQRAVYELARIKGLSQEEIAAELSISKHTVKVHMSAALQSIRTYLSSYYPDALVTVPVIQLLLQVLEK
ncbi:RNA polymerase sigma factor [Filimonas effusa]|uniref:RNA polymerase sigma-70 factor n=1 Tax=Filimonas effusa TaxID=2508721 RepID=A0A4Q1DAB6_9BACT|nr:RNA polymerase sigma-70 factor [Filimonas effusa]RXK85419.1 RNA polymerase sigma-70 factor [Filimonas effusa]